MVLNPQWYWKSDLRGKDDKDDVWSEYDTADSKAIEKAYKNKDTAFKLNSKYTIDFKNMLQYRNTDSSKQRAIKREKVHKRAVSSDDDSSDDDTYPKAASKTLKGLAIVFSGKLSQARAQMQSLAINNGARVTENVSGVTDVLVTTPEEIRIRSTKVTDAKAHNVPIVYEKWLQKSLRLKHPIAYTKYKQNNRV